MTTLAEEPPYEDHLAATDDIGTVVSLIDEHAATRPHRVGAA